MLSVLNCLLLQLITDPLITIQRKYHFIPMLNQSTRGVVNGILEKQEQTKMLHIRRISRHHTKLVESYLNHGMSGVTVANQLEPCDVWRHCG